jgi:hypothetical protein
LESDDHSLTKSWQSDDMVLPHNLIFLNKYPQISLVPY